MLIMARLKGVPRLKDGAKLLFNLSWMSCIIYTLLLKLVDDDLTKQKPSHLASETGNILLSDLGFISQPKLYPQGYHHLEDKEWPVFALALESGEMDKFISFLLSFRTYFLDHRLVIFNINLNEKQKDFVRERCFCQVREVWWKRYPSHVRNLRLEAYIPLLIQQSLQEFGSVFWCDVQMKFNSSKLKPTLSTQALTYGLTVWARDPYPTSTYTHHRTYTHFEATLCGHLCLTERSRKVNQSDYYFHPMVFPVPGLYYNTDRLHRLVMQPWVECVLTADCVSPPGAQGTGCDLGRLKPRYKYSGCHRYATASFNVVLGRVYDFQAPYIGEVQVHGNSLVRKGVVGSYYMAQWNKNMLV